MLAVVVMVPVAVVVGVDIVVAYCVRISNLAMALNSYTLSCRP